MDEMNNRIGALQLFKAPFTHGGGYVFDADGNLVCDCARTTGVYIQTRRHHENLGNTIAEALNDYWSKHNVG